MAIQHVNRQGDVYYLHEGKTKTGKPMYYFSMKSEGAVVESIPKGYEIHENHAGQVFLRKIQPRQLTVEEEALVAQEVLKRAGPFFRTDVKGKSIVVYEGRMPVMRFTLTDAAARRFFVERWCFRGSIDDWFPLSEGALPSMAAKYCRHLGKESFFELM